MGVIENKIDITELQRSGGGGGGTAADVTYDNTTSHMTATDVQAALDELNLDIAEGLALVNTSVAANRTAITATQENLAPVEDGETSAHAYIDGNYLMHQNTLMVVTAGISIGDALTVGTNIEPANKIYAAETLLTASEDLDGILLDGTYYFLINDIPTHKPSSAPNANGYLQVKVHPNLIVTEQTYVSYVSGYPYMYRRRKFQDTWGDWYQISVTIVS